MIKILIANRGEIALRIMRTAREMGIATVAVYSVVDRLMPFVGYADEAVCIGPPAPGLSYLNAERIIRAALDQGADAIHPGYGFLSENAGFARKTRDAGLAFIGPSPEAIDQMGNKISARRSAERAGVPMLPGTNQAVRTTREALEALSRIGYPSLIKAAAGGGGKGMRVVHSREEVEQQLKSAASEAMTAFGDDAVFIEKYVQSPRHIEIQVLGDQHGNYVHLFERECSIQRRHQKLIEEAPSSCLTPEIREQMGASALEIARSCGYYGAGTVEFLVDEQLRFYFLEMNTRLQVEHPVTEWITGLDLVREQIRIATGEPLGYSQKDLSIMGHSIELRVCAEDPGHDFLPETGRLEQYRRPSGIGIRVDDGYEQGLEIPIHYDPLLSKLISWGKDRQQAIARLVRAIGEYEVAGVPTTLGFGSWALEHPAFVSGQFDTFFISKYFRPEHPPEGDHASEEIAALVGAWILDQEKKQVVVTPKDPAPASLWKSRRWPD